MNQIDQSKRNHLIVLAGGFGTRLKKVTGRTPKPLVDVWGKPFIYYLIDRWFQSKVTDYIFLLYYEGHQIEGIVRQKFINSPAHVCTVEFIHESTPMGTGGAVAQALRKVNADEFIIVNADTWLPNGVMTLIKAPTPAIGTVFVDDVSRFGTLDINNGLVSQFKEKTGILAPGDINAGIYKLKRDDFNNCEAGKFDLENSILKVLAAQGKLKPVAIDGDFIDIGIPEDLLRFKKLIKGEEKEVKKLELFIVSELSSIADALKCFEANLSKIVFIENKNKQIIGSLSDGDIRRGLLSDCTLESSVLSCINKKFVSVPEGASQASILKQFDRDVTVLPVIGDTGSLIDIILKEDFSVMDTHPTYVLSRAPTRVTFSGGGSD